MRLAILFYSALSAAALLWGYVSDSPNIVYNSEAITLELLLLSLGGGALLGGATVLLSRLLLRWFDWAQELFSWFAEVMGPLRTSQAVILALASSVGEELLFRGPMLHSWGLTLSTLIFAALHLPPRLGFAYWPAMAGALGLGFGWLTLHTHTLAGAVLAHFIINALNLKHLAHYDRGEPPL